jgi:uncharacterized protein YciI
MSEPLVTKADILNACKDMLCKDLYVVFTTPTNGLGPVMENLDKHLEFQIHLEKTGVMFGAGPFFADNESDWNGEGMVIIRANSLADAQQIAAKDPMHQCGARSFKVRPWLLNEGTITIQLNYSDRSQKIL